MRIINTASGMTTLLLGRLGENERTQFVFDVADWLEEYPAATIAMYNQLPHSEESYPVVISQPENGKVTWTVADSELQTEGYGRCELVAVEGETVVKGHIWKTRILESLDGTGDVPDPWESWMTEFTQLKGAAEDAAEAAEDAKESIEGMSVEATTLPAGSDATVTKTVDPVTGAVTMSFGLPQGRPGTPGYEAIDDAAGLGDTDKAWSADKLSKEFAKDRNNANISGSLKVGTYNTTVQDANTVAFGRYSTAVGTNSLASGNDTNARGSASQAFGAGSKTEDDASASAVFGAGNIAKGAYQLVFGRYNAVDNGTPDSVGRRNYIEIVGNGNGTSSRLNARTLDWNGNERLRGNLYVEANVDGSGGTQVAKITDIPDLAIDDTAGTGDTDVTWSADKITGELADKYEKPASGIPATDLASGVIPTVHNVPAGGTAGQVLAKTSGTDYATEWVTPQIATDAQVADAVDDWLDENVAQETGYVLDRTLLLSNAAAPADLVGDLKNQINGLEDAVDGKAPAITNTLESAYIFTDVPSEVTIDYIYSATAFGNARYANNRNYVPVTTLDTTKNDLHISVVDRTIVVDGTASASSSIYVISFSTLDVPIPVGSYKFRFEVNKGSSAITYAQNIIVRAQYSDGTEGNLFTQSVKDTDVVVDVTTAKVINKIRVEFYFTSKNTYSNHRIWLGMYPADTTFVDVGEPVIDGSSVSAKISNITSPFIVDTVQHKSDCTYVVDTKTYVDNNIPDDVVTESDLVYVSPEMFGAIGDGVTDDINAWDLCVAEAIANDIPIRAYGNYKITSPLVISSPRPKRFGIYCNSLNYTGNTDAAIVYAGYNGFIDIKYISSGAKGIIITKNSTADTTQFNSFRIGYIYSQDDGLYITTNTSGVIAYNEFRINYINCVSGNGIVCDGSEIAENNFYNTYMRVPSGWAIYHPRGNFYNIAMESDCLNGIYVSDGDGAAFDNCRHIELIDKYIRRLAGDSSVTGGTLIKFVGIPYRFRYTNRVFIYYGAIDVSEMTTASEASVLIDLLHSTWVKIIDAPIVVGSSGIQNGYSFLGRQMYIQAGKKICVPLYESEYTITDTDFDMRDAQYEANNAKPYPTRMVIGVADCVIHLPTSYCCEGYSRFVVDQSDSSKLCTIYSAYDDTTPIFNGATLGAGVYELKAYADFANSSAGGRAVYDTTNDKWTVRKLT